MANARIILVVDDDPIVQSVIERIVRKAGYRALLASSGRQALELLTGEPGLRIATIDQGLPDTSGLALIGALGKRAPELRTILISGDTRPSDNLVRYAKDADVLLHEAIMPEYLDTVDKPDVAARLKSYHTTPEEAGQIAQNLRRSQDHQKTILVALSSSEPGEEIYSLGFNDAFKKPFDGVLLAERIRRLISQKKADEP